MADSQSQRSNKYPSFINLTPQGFSGAYEGHPFQLDESLNVSWLDETPSGANEIVQKMLVPHLEDYLGSTGRTRHVLNYCQNLGSDLRGITLGRFEPNAKVSFSSHSTHLVTIGTTGYGKFVRNLAPACLQYRGAIVVVDPKGEAAAVTARARFERHGQIPCLFDPFGKVRDQLGGELPAHALEVTFNPLRELDPTSKEFAADALSLASALLPGKSEKEPMWRNNAVSLLTGLIIYICTQPDDSKPRDLPYIRHLLSSTAEEWKFLFLKMARSTVPSVQNCARRMQGMPEVTFAGVVTQCNSDLNFLDDPLVCAALSDRGENQFTFAHLFANQRLPRLENEDFAHLNSKMTWWPHKNDLLEFLCCGGYSLYIIIPLEYSESHSGLLRLVINAFLSKSMKTRRFGPPTLLMIDEAAQLGELDGLAVAYSAGRANNIRVWSFWQNLTQIKATYPNKYSSIIGNAIQILIGTTDPETAEYFSKIAGKEIKMVRSSSTVSTGKTTTEGTSEGSSDSNSQTNSQGSSDGTNSSGGWGTPQSNGRSSGTNTGSSNGTTTSTNKGSSYSSGRTFSETYTDSRVIEEVIPPEKIMAECGPDTNKALVFVGGHGLFWINTVRYYEEPMARFADPNPDY